MKIGIDASRAFLENRTGIEEYSYKLVNYLTKNLGQHQVVLYLRKGQSANEELAKMHLARNVEIREIKFRRFWTQVGLAMEILINPIDVLFIPAHTIPWVHPRNTVVTIHGLEYEHCPESYSLYSRMMHRFFIKKSCRWAKRIVAVSEKTKVDLIEMYKTPAEKIEVVHNGFSISPFEKGGLRGFYEDDVNKNTPNLPLEKGGDQGRYILYIGRLEKRKNVDGIVEAFEILKEKYDYKGKLILAGRPGYGYGKIKSQISNLKSDLRDCVIEKGFIKEDEKWTLLENADVFLFPSLSEGFGIPILEAQSAGVPVITSNYGPMDEVAGDENVLIDPNNSREIAKLADKLINNNQFRKQVIEKGFENVKRFSWEKSANETKRVLESVFS